MKVKHLPQDVAQQKSFMDPVQVSAFMALSLLYDAQFRAVDVNKLEGRRSKKIKKLLLTEPPSAICLSLFAPGQLCPALVKT